MKRRLAGYDLNGWRDHCARSWRARHGEETVEDIEEVLFGGFVSQIVQTGQSGRHPFVGGLQAGLAQHGKGDGWGEVGQQGRFALRTLLDDPDCDTLAFSAAFRSLAPDPILAVMAIPDCAETTESHQETWLEAMRRSGVRQPYLVWRPVLAVLGSLERHSFSDRDRVGVVTQHGAGLTTQTLTLRDIGKLTPERRRSGVLHEAHGSLNTRLGRALAHLRQTETHGEREPLETAAMPGHVALGEATGPEPFRRKNGSWGILAPFDQKLPPEPVLFETIAAQVSECDVVLFDARFGPALAMQLETELTEALGRPVTRVPCETVALGALEAARRLSGGEPAFFDFLPQVSTLVQGAEGALTHNLVPEDEVLPAGKLYVSRTPARFHLLPGQDQISVYLRKETEPAPRLARLEGIAKPDKATEVQLTLEQQPVAGRARLTLTSAALPTPHVIDFEAAETQGETWEEIIARHERPRPTIPDRLVLQCGMQVWDGFANRHGLSELLKREAARASPDWGALATQLSARPEQRYAISSDGSVPQVLPLDDEAALDQMIDRAKDEVLSRLATRRYRDNHTLRFLTWTFRRCPQEVIPHILAALDGPGHPFRGRGRLTLLLQGLGRTLRQPNDMRRAMDYLLALPSAAWKKDQTACMAFLISRTDDALPLLERPDVEYLAEIVRAGLERECGRHYTSTFIYLPILLVGLLRWRMVEPWALVAGRDPAADRMAEPLDAIIRDVTRRTGRDPRLVRYVDLLKASREALSGRGGHSHLLADLFGLTTGASS